MLDSCRPATWKAVRLSDSGGAGAARPVGAREEVEACIRGCMQQPACASAAICGQVAWASGMEKVRHEESYRLALRH